jgi:uncharacterized membrane protein required for colicin V production
MSDYLILDILFALIVVLFGAIGMWRGVVKEIPVTAAVFAGAALASSWSLPWGDDLAREFDLRTDVSRMIVTAVALLGATLILGYGGGALIATPDIGWGSRIVGGLLAAINGVLILHYVLNGVERFFTSGSTREALNQSEVARVSLREFGWLLIGAAALLTLCLLVAVLRGRDRSEFDYAPAVLDGTSALHTDERGRPVRLPKSADSGKFEPAASEYDSRSGRYVADSPSIQQTVALPPVDANRVAYEGGRSAPPSSSGSSRDQPDGSPRTRYSGDEWIRRAPYTQINNEPSINRVPSSDSQPEARAQSAETRESLSDPGQNGHHSINGSSPFSWIGYPPASDIGSITSQGAELDQQRRCQHCAGEVGPDDDFCPHCGNRVVST